jgi:hypothetical protein
MNVADRTAKMSSLFMAGTALPREIFEGDGVRCIWIASFVVEPEAILPNLAGTVAGFA